MPLLGVNFLVMSIMSAKGRSRAIVVVWDVPVFLLKTKRFRDDAVGRNFFAIFKGKNKGVEPS